MAINYIIVFENGFLRGKRETNFMQGIIRNENPDRGQTALHIKKSSEANEKRKGENRINAMTVIPPPPRSA